MPLRQKLIILVLPLIGTLGFGQFHGDFSAPALRVTSTWSDNLSHTSHLPTKKTGQFYTVSTSLDYVDQLNRDWLLVAEGRLLGDYVPKYDALNSLTSSGELKLRHKFGLGAYAPVLQFNAGLLASQFNESDRSGWQYFYGATLSKRFTHSLSLSASATWEDYFGNDPVFDVTNHGVELEGHWDITRRWRVSLGASRTWGEFTANAAGKIWPLAIGGQLGPAIEQHYNTLAWKVSDSYGKGWVAYRNRDSTLDAWWCAVSPALTETTSLSLRYEFQLATNAIGIEYDYHLWTLGVNHQF